MKAAYGTTACEILAIASDHPPLGKSEERCFLEAAVKGDRKAKEKILFHSMRLIISLTRESVKCKRANPFEDTLQEAIAFTWLLIDKFDISSDNKFSSYLYPSLRHRLWQIHAEEGGLIHATRCAARKGNFNFNVDKFEFIDELPEEELGEESEDPILQSCRERLALWEKNLDAGDFNYLMRYYSTSGAELAEELGVSVSSVKMRITRIKKRAESSSSPRPPRTLKNPIQMALIF